MRAAAASEAPGARRNRRGASRSAMPRVDAVTRRPRRSTGSTATARLAEIAPRRCARAALLALFWNRRVGGRPGQPRDRGARRSPPRRRAEPPRATPGAPAFAAHRRRSSRSRSAVFANRAGARRRRAGGAASGRSASSASLDRQRAGSSAGARARALAQRDRHECPYRTDVAVACAADLRQAAAARSPGSAGSRRARGTRSSPGRSRSRARTSARAPRRSSSRAITSASRPRRTRSSRAGWRAGCGTRPVAALAVVRGDHHHALAVRERRPAATCAGGRYLRARRREHARWACRPPTRRTWLFLASALYTRRSRWCSVRA